jgi:hypothetical protein
VLHHLDSISSHNLHNLDSISSHNHWYFHVLTCFILWLFNWGRLFIKFKFYSWGYSGNSLFVLSLITRYAHRTSTELTSFFSILSRPSRLVKIDRIE